MVPFLVSGLLFLVASYNVLKIDRPATLPARAPMTFESVFAGVVFIKSKPVMLGSISLDLFAVLLGGATAMLPVYARDILHAGPWALGFLRMAPAVGAVVMSLLLARFPLQHKVGFKMLVAVAIFGAATIVFAYSTNIILSVVMLVILGASDTVSVVVRSSLVQLLTPDHMRGRVNAVNTLFIGTGTLGVAKDFRNRISIFSELNRPKFFSWSDGSSSLMGMSYGPTRTCDGIFI